MKQELAKNLVIEVDDDQVLHMTVDLKQIACKSVNKGHDMACSTRGHRDIMELVDGELRPSGWLAIVNIYKKGS